MLRAVINDGVAAYPVLVFVDASGMVDCLLGPCSPEPGPTKVPVVELRLRIVGLRLYPKACVWSGCRKKAGTVGR